MRWLWIGVLASTIIIVIDTLRGSALPAPAAGLIGGLVGLLAYGAISFLDPDRRTR